MLVESLKRLFEDLPSRHLDDILDEIKVAGSQERRLMLAAEVARRFNQDVERACRFAGVSDSQTAAGDIIDKALRWLGPESSTYFSREVVRVMKTELGTEAASHVTSYLYLRQFVTEIRPRRLIRYAHAFLDNEMELTWTAEALREDETAVQRKVEKAWSRLKDAIRTEYADEEFADRTDGVWTHVALEQ